MAALHANCVNGGHAYVGHGINCVMVAFTADVKWWKNSAWLHPDEARALGNALLRQADDAEAAAQSDEKETPR